MSEHLQCANEWPYLAHKLPAVCSCGAKSGPLPSATHRRLAFEQHLADVAAVEAVTR